MKTRDILGIVAAILFLLLCWFGYSNYTLKGEKAGLLKDNDALSSQMADLETLKTELETEVDSLQSAYEVLADENENLQGSLAEANDNLQKKGREVRKVRTALKNLEEETDARYRGLQAEIRDLLSAKSDLENNIKSLQTENDSLKALTGVLTVDLDKARKDNAELANLNRSIAGEVDRLTLANFKASAFRAEVKKRNNSKVTAKSRKAKAIDVSFDLTNVPEKYQGVRPIYLVIADDKATPIKLDKPITAKIVVNGQETDIIAAEAKEVNIETNQRLSFTHKLNTKLKSGYYRISVYTDIGLLGASSLKLR